MDKVSEERGSPDHWVLFYNEESNVYPFGQLSRNRCGTLDDKPKFVSQLPIFIF